MKTCAGCGKSEETEGSFQQCGRCHQTCYCSRECQRNHWKSHKKECVAPAEPVPETDPNYPPEVQSGLADDLTALLCEIRDQPELRQDWFQRAYLGFTKWGRGLLAVHFSSPEHMKHDLEAIRNHQVCRFRVAYIGQDDSNLAHLSPRLPLGALRQSMGQYEPTSQFVVLAHLLLPEPTPPAEGDKSRPLSSMPPAAPAPATPGRLTPTLDKYAVIAANPDGRSVPLPSGAAPAAQVWLSGISDRVMTRLLSQGMGSLQDIQQALRSLEAATGLSPESESSADEPAKKSGMTREDREHEVQHSLDELASKGLLEGELPADLRAHLDRYVAEGAPVMRTIDSPNGPVAICLRRHDDPPPEREFSAFLSDLLIREARWKEEHPEQHVMPAICQHLASPAPAVMERQHDSGSIPRPVTAVRTVLNPILRGRANPMAFQGFRGVHFHGDGLCGERIARAAWVGRA
ncbi:hypothetical protein PAPYR_397 [Paratrimastix pyriformis]|uniref:MYND-type domain-containing protein n=1 Tax=Paratrimastix pyriformis TaxID=342808 RepID=A0ABQ8UVL0_9EUKA|nr:hypothetical protein PAPYR_397 [Paratrimastix pyriformis]